MRHLFLLLSWCLAAGPEPELNRVREAFFRADALPAGEERTAALTDLLAKAEPLRQKKSERAAGLYWWAAIYGEWILTQGKLAALSHLPELEKNLLQLHELDPNYGSAAADRVLGRIYHQAPGWISIGSNRKAREHFEAALARFPDHPGNQILMADFLVSQGERDRARQLAQSGLKNMGSANPYEKNRWTSIAKKVLEP